MNMKHRIKLPALAASLLAVFLPLRLMADDIDIFMGSSGSNANAPNVIFLLDNSTNWSKNSQQWPDNGGTQGVAELNALSTMLNSITAASPVNVGLVMLTTYKGSGGTKGSGGGYVRFGARDMSVAQNRTALQTILADIAAKVQDPSEKINESSKDEDAAFYEIYKYLSGLTPYTGPYSQNPYADVAANTAAETPAGLTPASQRLTSGFAISSGNVYQTPLSSTKPCARTYIVFIDNNSQGGAYSPGQAYYEQNPPTAGTALTATSGADTWTDEWAKFLYTNGVQVPTGNTNGSVVTYVLDAYYKQQNVGYSNSLIGAAKQGGGKYFQVGSQAAITAALATILTEVQAVNSTFASASLPVSSTNRAQNNNEVFIPMFRVDPNAAPRWMGNLKRYQLIAQTSGTTTSIELGDYSTPSIPAVNTLTGFATPCALSFDTVDSNTYWIGETETPSPQGTCATSSNSVWSDAPDGPFVEKGGVAQVIRRGNNPPTTTTTPTYGVNRTVYTLSGLTSTSLVPFNTTNTGLTSNLVKYMLGYDTYATDQNPELTGNSATKTRPSLHGDVIHSRPLPVDYGGTTGVYVYYGSNDGTFRAVNAATGAEQWAFIAPEFYTSATGFTRLQADSPQINFFGMPAGITPTPTAKNYYFDGSIGLYESSGNSHVWIYPTMRRGGRMIYAFDVTTPASPTVKWKVGCPNLTDNTGCTTGMTDSTTSIGQTWSTPVVAASVNGYTTGPVIIVGGGYDSCEDANTATPSCSSETGSAVYVLDAGTGAVVKKFYTTRAVAADVSLIAVSTVGIVDHAYAVDTGGNIYRIDFGATTASWVMNKVAYTNGGGRKFLFAPALLLAPGGQQVYVAVGSGDREHPLQAQYPYGGVTNRFYVYLDNLLSTTANDLDSTMSTGGLADLTTATTCGTTGILPGSTLKGWFMTLGYGEQVVTSAAIAAGQVAFSTNTPVPTTASSCTSSLGLAQGYLVNLFNGSGSVGASGAACGGARSGSFVGGGLPPSPVLAAVNIGGQIDTVIIGAAQQSGAASTVIGAQQLKPAIVPTRRQIYWHSSGQN